MLSNLCRVEQMIVEHNATIDAQDDLGSTPAHSKRWLSDECFVIVLVVVVVVAVCCFLSIRLSECCCVDPYAA